MLVFRGPTLSCRRPYLLCKRSLFVLSGDLQCFCIVRALLCLMFCQEPYSTVLRVVTGPTLFCQEPYSTILRVVMGPTLFCQGPFFVLSGVLLCVVRGTTFSCQGAYHGHAGPGSVVSSPISLLGRQFRQVRLLHEKFSKFSFPVMFCHSFLRLQFLS
jgi:hypothetical protein